MPGEPANYPLRLPQLRVRSPGHFRSKGLQVGLGQIVEDSILFRPEPFLAPEQSGEKREDNKSTNLHGALPGMMELDSRIREIVAGDDPNLLCGGGIKGPHRRVI